MAKTKVKKEVKKIDFENFDDMVDGIIADTEHASDINTELEWISCGNLAGNMALSGTPNAGVPFGKIVNVEGESDTGKTLLAQTFIRESQMKYGSKSRCLYVDVERGVDLARLEQMGMFTRRKAKKGKKPDPKKWEDTTNNPLAGTFRAIETTDLTEIAQNIIPNFTNALRQNPDYRGILCIDSISMLVTTHEREADFETRDMTRAVEIRKFLRLLNDRFPKNLLVFNIHHQSAVIKTNQYESYDDTREMKKTISGGKASKYVPDIRISVDYAGKEQRVSGGKKHIIGQIARLKVIKTRLSRPMIEADLTIDHSYGFTRTGGLFDQLKQSGLVVPAGAMWKCPDISGDKKWHINALKDEIEKEENSQKVCDLIMEQITMAGFTTNETNGKEAAKEEEEEEFDLGQV